MWPPSGVGQLRHCTPYTGPRSSAPSRYGLASHWLFSLAFWSQTLQPRSRNSAALRDARRNPTISPTADLNASFLVVTAGNPFCRSKRSDAPGMLRVRIPVRFSCHAPVSRMV
ncbi:hypothetical protein D9M69_728360 [compost metagenome]